MCPWTLTANHALIRPFTLLRACADWFIDHEIGGLQRISDQPEKLQQHGSSPLQPLSWQRRRFWFSRSPCQALPCHATLGSLSVSARSVSILSTVDHNVVVLINNELQPAKSLHFCDHRSCWCPNWIQILWHRSARFGWRPLLSCVPAVKRAYSVQTVRSHNVCCFGEVRQVTTQPQLSSLFTHVYCAPIHLWNLCMTTSAREELGNTSTSMVMFLQTTWWMLSQIHEELCQAFQNLSACQWRLIRSQLSFHLCLQIPRDLQ